MKSSREMLFFSNEKTHAVYFVFHFMHLYFFPYECSDLFDSDQGICKVKI